jgi:hypothetical protein
VGISRASVPPRRWVERTSSKLVRGQHLARDYSRLPETHEEMVASATLGMTARPPHTPPGPSVDVKGEGRLRLRITFES